MHIYIYIMIYFNIIIYHITAVGADEVVCAGGLPVVDVGQDADVPRLRTNGLDANGGAAKVMNFDRLGEQVRPGTFGKINIG